MGQSIQRWFTSIVRRCRLPSESALNSEGLAQACMGIAADDFNSDGSTDLFVTNFYNEPNAFYVFNSTGFATDEALLSGIRRSSIPMLGFGAQSIDSNCDSMPDIFLANGDIDDFSHEGRPFQMVPQLLVNDGQGRFHEEIAGHTSDIRNALMRGRGVAHWTGTMTINGIWQSHVLIPPRAWRHCVQTALVDSLR